MKVFLSILIFCAVYTIYCILKERNVFSKIWRNTRDWFTNQNEQIKYTISIISISFILTLLVSHDITLKELCYSFIKITSDICLIVVIYKTIEIIYYAFHKDFPSIRIGLVVFSLILVLVATPSALYYLGGGIECPGALFEKKEYEGNFIVTMSRNPKSTSERTVYYLPAHISKYCEVVDEYTHYTWYTGEREEEYIESSLYHINHLYFSNGGYSTFYEDNILHLNEEARVTDYEGNTYYITLTDMPCEEHKPKSENLSTQDMYTPKYYSTKKMNRDEFLKERDAVWEKKEAEQATNP